MEVSQFAPVLHPSRHRLRYLGCTVREWSAELSSCVDWFVGEWARQPTEWEPGSRGPGSRGGAVVEAQCSAGPGAHLTCRELSARAENGVRETPPVIRARCGSLVSTEARRCCVGTRSWTAGAESPGRRACHGRCGGFPDERAPGERPGARVERPGASGGQRCTPRARMSMGGELTAPVRAHIFWHSGSVFEPRRGVREVEGGGLENR